MKVLCRQEQLDVSFRERKKNPQIIEIIEIIEPEAGVVDSESIHSGNPPQACNPIRRRSSFKTCRCIQRRERERQLESAEASSMAVIYRLASAPLFWVQWLSSKSVRLAGAYERRKVAQRSIKLLYISWPHPLLNLVPPKRAL